MYRFFLRPLLFLFDPETVHHAVFRLLKITLSIPGKKAAFRWLYCVRDPQLEREVFGIRFPNPVGLAAGFDKDARLVDELATLGFGFVEIGTLTPKAQPGNDKPRLFRLVADSAIINRMGFNNEGVDAAVRRLKKRHSSIIVGGNIGKNKHTPNEQAADDYLACFDALYEVVDYFVVNVSSPNTPNLRALQDKAPLTSLLATLQQRNGEKPAKKPILLKIAPDLTNEQLDDIIVIVRETGIAGVIATNTTISREGLKTPAKTVEKIGAGGLSGQPLTHRATEVIRYLTEKSGNAFPVIGAGGIMTPQDALDKLEAGASLVQVYTGFVYRGPALVKQINKCLINRAC